jgi:hypothetical protein
MSDSEQESKAAGSQDREESGRFFEPFRAPITAPPHF